jgi:hypothetical protein
MSKLTQIGDHQFNIEAIIHRLEVSSLYGGDRTLFALVAGLIRVQQQRIQELTALLERSHEKPWHEPREMRFGDIYHLPEWRLCMVQNCPQILRRPVFVCEFHALGIRESIDG